MNFRENESAIKLRGAYYTSPEIALFLTRWVLSVNPETILEPSCGDGIFFKTISELENKSLKSVKGFEIKVEECEKAKETASLIRNAKVEIISSDFLIWSLFQFSKPSAFDAVIGNPPFIRYQYLDEQAQDLACRIFRYFGLPFTKHTNAWVPFVISSLALLKPKGRLAMVVPSELLHVLHAESLRKFLIEQCSRVLIFDPQELWFENTLQGAVLLLVEKKERPTEKSQGIAIIQTQGKDFLEQNPEDLFQSATYTNGDMIKGKWMRALLNRSELNLLQKAEENQHVHKFEEVAKVAVGIVTGANNFFLVPDSVIDEYGLDKWSYPMFGKSNHVPGIIYDETIINRNKLKGIPTNFLWFEDEKIENLPSSVKSYIELGEAQKLHQRYKCRIRQPWYSVPSVYSTSVGMMKRCHDFPRLIFNKVQAFTTDTAYRISSKETDNASLVYSFINSLTALTAELEGRHYGGGVLELVPSEIRKVLIPSYKASENEVYKLSEVVGKGFKAESVLAKQDNIILKKIGFTDSDCEEILHAWLKLRSRRQRLEIEAI